MTVSFLTRLWVCLALLFSDGVVADDDGLEYKVKAGYIYNFTKFVTWTAINNPTFNLCLLGNDPFGADIDAIEKKTVLSRAIKIIRLNDHKPLTSQNPPPNCQILYVSDNANLKKILQKISDRLIKDSTLLIGEGEEFAKNGGMIGFVNRNGKIKLQINLQSASKSHLHISAKLLEIAELIKVVGHD